MTSEYKTIDKIDQGLNELLKSTTETTRTTNNDNETGSILIDDVGKCREITNRLLRERKQIAIDFEGIDLDHNGELCIIPCIQLEDNGRVYLFDIIAMNNECFSEGGLKELLESQFVKKVIFDGRHGANILYHKFSVSLNNIYDIQICSVKRQESLEGRKENKFFVSKAQAFCRYLEHDFHRNYEMKQAKKEGKLLINNFNQVWKQRPIHYELIKYASQDVELLHDIKAAWCRFCPEEANNALATTRIHKFIHAPYISKGQIEMKDF